MPAADQSFRPNPYSQTIYDDLGNERISLRRTPEFHRAWHKIGEVRMQSASFCSQLLSAAPLSSATKMHARMLQLSPDQASVQGCGGQGSAKLKASISRTWSRPLCLRAPPRYYLTLAGTVCNSTYFLSALPSISVHAHPFFQRDKPLLRTNQLATQKRQSRTRASLGSS